MCVRTGTSDTGEGLPARAELAEPRSAGEKARQLLQIANTVATKRTNRLGAAMAGRNRSSGSDRVRCIPRMMLKCFDFINNCGGRRSDLL
jgi:hypothetical protein